MTMNKKVGEKEGEEKIQGVRGYEELFYASKGFSTTKKYMGVKMFISPPLTK